MISRQFLRTVLAVEVVIAVIALASVAVHALWLWRRQHADRPRLDRARAALAEALTAAPGDDGVWSDRMAELGRLHRRVQRRVVQQLAVAVTGTEGRGAGDAAEELGLVAAARRRCRSRRWWRRLLGAHELNVYGSGDDVLPRLFDDPHPAVRAQVIEWAGDTRRESLAPRLVSAMHDPAAICRNTAADSILRAGAPLVDALTREVSARSGQEQADLLAVLARRPDGRYRDVSLAAVTGDLPALRAAGAAVLGGVGGPNAAAALRVLLTDTDAAVRAAAADGLRRLEHQPAAPDIAALLRDPSFEVRRAAGTALAGLGPVGILLLRHYLDDADPFAADMARQSLDILALGATGARTRPT